MTNPAGHTRKKSKYEVVTDELALRIERGEFKADTPLPPIRELMAMFGFSLATVTRALSILESRGLVRSSRGKGIFVEPRRPTAAGVLAVTTNPGTQEALSPVWSRLRIGVVSTFPHTHRGEMWWSRILAGADQIVRETGGGTQLRLVTVNGQSPADLVAQCNNDGINALINLGDHWSAVELLSFARAARERHMPTVMTWTSQPQPLPVNLIKPDNHIGIAEAVRHLVDLGHRRIGFLAFSESYAWSVEREHAFRVALAASGLTPVLRTAIPQQEALDKAPELKHIADSCTAVVCANDDLAAALLKWARAHRRSVPDDLSIVGFDDDTLYRQFELTTVNDDMARLGREAVRLMAHLLESGDGNMRLTLHLPTRLVVRRTTGIPHEQTLK